MSFMEDECSEMQSRKSNRNGGRRDNNVPRITTTKQWRAAMKERTSQITK